MIKEDFIEKLGKEWNSEEDLAKKYKLKRKLWFIRYYTERYSLNDKLFKLV